VHEGFFQRLLLLGIKIVVILGNVRQCFSQSATTTHSKFLLAQSNFEASLATLERLVDRLRAGGEATLKGRESEPDRPLARTLHLVCLAHFGLDVLGDGLV